MADKYQRRLLTKIWPDVNEDRDSVNYGCIPKFDTPEKFIDEKIEMLRDHFYIQITDEDIAYLRQFKKENEINAAVKSILNKYWK